MSDVIAFKGVADGVYLEIKTEDLNLVKQEIDKTMKKSKKFFKGTNFLGVEGQNISAKDKLDIAYLLKYRYDFNISMDNLMAPLKEEFLQSEEEIVEKIVTEDLDENISEIVTEGMTKFVYGTVRSGQEIAYDGNIVIVGDVNPGAHLKANGNIIILGTLRGVAYAGLDGNKKAIVAAYKLIPTQLGIGDLIVRAPDGDEAKYKVPEVAKIINNGVIIEPYLPNK